MTTITFETYGRILAHLLCRRHAQLAEVLSDLSVDHGEFERDEPGLRNELAEAWRNRRGISAMKFAAALGAELQRLGPLGGDGAGPPPPGAVPLLAAPPEVRETEMPSYLQAPIPSAHGGIVAPPFLAPAAASTGAEPTAPVAPPALVRAEATSPSSFAGTAPLNLSAIVASVKQGSLPFAPAQSPGAFAAQAPDPADAPKQRVPAVGSETVGADFSAIVAAVKRGALPFSHSEQPNVGHAEALEEPDLTQLPLETFAAVSGELARGESRDVALAKHGLTSAAFDLLAKAWAQRFQREPQLLERFKELARNNAAMGRGGDGRR